MSDSSDLSLKFEGFDDTLVPDNRGCEFYPTFFLKLLEFPGFSLLPNLENAAFAKNLTDQPEDVGFPKLRFTSLVPERPSSKIPVSQRDLTLEDLPKMRDSSVVSY